MYWRRVKIFASFLIFFCVMVPALADPGSASIGQGLQKVSAYYLKAGESSGILILGVRHTNDPFDIQIREIEDQLIAFSPTEILVEGGRWPLADDKEGAVMKYGEMGFVYFMANRFGVPVFDADPGLSQEMEYVAKAHGPIPTKLYYALRMLRQFREERSGRDVDSLMADWLNSHEFDDSPSLKGIMNTISDLEGEAGRLMPGLRDWRAMPYQWTENSGNYSILNDIARTSSIYRDNYLTSELVSRMSIGRRILVVVGLSHLDAQRVTLLPALKKK